MKQTCLLCLVFGCILSTSVFAAVTLDTNRGDFNGRGVITYNYGFEDYSGSAFYFPGDPFTRDGVTYTTTENLVVSPISGYEPQSNVFINNWWTPLTAEIDQSAQFTMFGFDLGVLNTDSLLDVDISTNLDTYRFANLDVPNVNQGMNFYGFTTGSGEYFTGVTMVSQYGQLSAPAIDNVTLGHVQISTVPVPSSILLAGIGIISVGRFLRKR